MNIDWSKKSSIVCRALNLEADVNVVDSMWKHMIERGDYLILVSTPFFHFI